MTDDYAFWRTALAGTRGPVHENEPQCGFYRKASKNRVAEPVAIWRGEDGALVALVGDKQATDVEALWTWVCEKPITEEVYRAVRAGQPWPDLAPLLSAPPAPAGHNSGEVDAAATLRDQIEAAKAGVAEFEKIRDDTHQAAAQSLRSRLLELHREADKTREAEKRPHLEAGRAVDERYKPLVNAAKEAADAIALAMSAFETEKARKAEAERRAREEAIRKAEEERRATEAANAPAPANPDPIPEPDPEPVASAPIRGAYGRAASVRVVRVARVVDQDAVYRFMSKREELVDLLASLAQRAVNAGHEVPGVEVTEKRKVA